MVGEWRQVQRSRRAHNVLLLSLNTHKDAQQLPAEHLSFHKHDNRGVPSPPVSTNLSLESIATLYTHFLFRFALLFFPKDKIELHLELASFVEFNQSSTIWHNVHMYIEQYILSLYIYIWHFKPISEPSMHFIAVDLPNFVTGKWNKEKETEMVGHSLVVTSESMNEWWNKDYCSATDNSTSSEMTYGEAFHFATLPCFCRSCPMGLSAVLACLNHYAR